MATILGGYQESDASKGTSLKEVTVYTQGNKTALNVTNLNSLVFEPFDYIGVAYPSGATETYTYKTGGASGTTVATITVVYTDSTKADLSSVTRS
jgi:hypothetical protein